MQPETIISNSSPHPNYKRVIVIVAIIFVMIIAAAFVYQYFVNKKAEKARDLVLREQYRTELLVEVEEFMKSSKKPAPLDAKAKKAMIEFFAQSQPQPFTEENAKQFTIQFEASYQKWKTSHQ